MNKIFTSIVLLLCIVVASEAQITKTVVGATRYDLQTNNSIARRIVVDPATGKMVITYTASLDGDPGSGAFLSRGTGYYYYGGTGPLAVEDTFRGRIENARVGWPNPLFLNGGKEAVISHVSDGGFNGLKFTSRGTSGTGAWSNMNITAGVETWPRAANTGDSIFVISSLFIGTGGTATLPNGMSGGIGFKRSFDGGTTWIPAVSATNGLDTIPGLGLAKYPNGANNTGNALGGDTYALDVKGQKVAILTGSRDVTLFLSNDFGNTWTSKTILDGDNSSADPLPIEDRSTQEFSVIIDNNGLVHCFYARAQGNGLTYSTARAGIMYWNENMVGKKPVLIPKTEYTKENSAHSLLYLPLYTCSIFTTLDLSNLSPTYNQTGTFQPSCGIDANNHVYLTFARMRAISDTNRFLAGKQSDAKGNFMNEIYIMKTADNGATWLGPLNVSTTDSMEEAFPSMARHVGTDAHIVYQQDPLFNIAIRSNTDESHLGVTTRNRMIYAKVPTSLITAQIDVTPPIVGIRDSIVEKFNIQRFGDTLKMYQGCNKFLNTNISIGSDIKQFAIDHFMTVYDDTDTSVYSLARIDTPNGFRINQVGVYELKMFGKDAAGNTSIFFGGTSGTQTLIGSRDTLSIFIQVLGGDNQPPTISLSSREAFVKTGSTFSLSSITFSSIDDNPCGSPTNTLPQASEVNTAVPGLYKLVYKAKDVANNTSVDTLKVYVGEVPVAVITDESVAGGVLKGSGTTSQNINTGLFTETYKWLTRSASNVVNNVNKLGATASTANLNYTLVKTGTNRNDSFSSICLEVTNRFNAGLGEPAVRTCKNLKWSFLSINNITLKENQVTVFPNPSDGIFQIKFTSPTRQKEARITIVDMQGRVVYHEKLRLDNQGTVIINEPGRFSKGKYVIDTELGNYKSSNYIEIH